MTLSIAATPQQYQGDGTDAVLPTVFKFFTATDIIVTQRIFSTGVSVVLVKDTHYSVSGGSATGADGDVTVISGATNFTSLMLWTIERAIPNEQDLDYIANDNFPASSHETGLDGITMQNQDAAARANRSIRFPVHDLTSLNSKLPSSVERANKVLGFDATGNVVATTVSGFGSGKVLLASASPSTDATVPLVSENWPAIYDRIELELVDVRPDSAALLTLKPIDNGSASTTNLSIQAVETSGGSASSENDTDWILGTTTGATGDDGIGGSAIFTYNGGYLAGDAAWTFRGGSGHVSSSASYQRHTTVGTRWDGIEVSFSGGNNVLSGTIRLWGLPKS